MCALFAVAKLLLFPIYSLMFPVALFFYHDNLVTICLIHQIESSAFFVFYFSLQCVHRQPKECKERHKVLVDRSSGDCGDSADDSGSSQHYHNTLPGIPKACSPTTLFCGYSLLPVMYVGCNSHRCNIQPFIFSSCHTFLKNRVCFY